MQTPSSSAHLQDSAPLPVGPNAQHLSWALLMSQMPLYLPTSLWGIVGHQEQHFCHFLSFSRLQIPMHCEQTAKRKARTWHSPSLLLLKLSGKKWKIHRREYTDMKLNLLKKYGTAIYQSGNLFWVLRECSDGCFLWNTGAGGDMLLGCSLMISHHHPQSYQILTELRSQIMQVCC